MSPNYSLVPPKYLRVRRYRARLRSPKERSRMYDLWFLAVMFVAAVGIYTIFAMLLHQGELVRLRRMALADAARHAPDAARKLSVDVLPYNRRDREAWYQLGLLWETTEPTAATTAFEHAEALGMVRADLFRRLGDLYAARNRKHSARVAYARYLTLSSTSPTEAATRQRVQAAIRSLQGQPRMGVRAGVP